MENLIHNAIKFSKTEIRLHIDIKSGLINSAELEKETNYCYIGFGDNGIGFDPQYNENIWSLSEITWERYL